MNGLMGDFSGISPQSGQRPYVEADQVECDEWKMVKMKFIMHYFN